MAPGIDRRRPPDGAHFGTWRAPDGFGLRRMDWPQPPGGPIRGSLLFLGGRSDFIEKYLEPLAHWHGRGWSVSTLDWRGQGASRAADERVPGHLTSFDPLIDDCGAFLREWTRETPGPHVAIAHSMGGHLLLRTIVDRRPALDAAVLVAPMIAVNATPIPIWLGRRIARLLNGCGLSERRAWKENERPAPPGSSRQAFLTSSTERYEDEIWWRERHPAYGLGPPTWGWLNAAYQSSAKLGPDRLRRVDMPILLLGTERDRLVSPTAIKRAAAALPNAELVMFRDAAHELLRESDPVRLEALAQIDAFLDLAAAP